MPENTPEIRSISDALKILGYEIDEKPPKFFGLDQESVWRQLEEKYKKQKR